MIDAKWEGHRTEAFEVSVSRHDNRQYAHALGLQNPLYYHLDTAEEYGLPDLLVPATLPITFWRHVHLPWINKDDSLIHGFQSFHYTQPIFANEKILCTIQLDKISRKKSKGRFMQFLTHTLDGRTLDGKRLFQAETTLIKVATSSLSQQQRGLSKQQANHGPEKSARSNQPMSFQEDWAGQDDHSTSMKQDFQAFTIPARLSERMDAQMVETYANVSGDSNAIHLSPTMAQKYGFQRPIVHGMLQMGKFLKLIDANITNLSVKEISAKFVSPLYVHDPLHLKVMTHELIKKSDKETKAYQLKIRGQDAYGRNMISGTLVYEV